MTNNPIAIIGGGHVGHAMAADLTLAGHAINLYEHPHFKDAFLSTLTGGKIRLWGAGRQGTVELHKVTLNMKEALQGVELINVVLPAFGHDLFFSEMIPCLRPGQIVIIWAGDFGSLRLANLLAERVNEIIIAETNTVPYGCRLSRPSEVEILLTATKVMIAALPATDTDRVLEKLHQIHPVLVPLPNVLAVAFSNPNPLVHPPGVLLNAGRIQYSQGEFYMYREGITEAVARVIRSLYQEIKAVATALGVAIVSYEEKDFASKVSVFACDWEAPFDTIGTIARFKGPASLQNRYITEDLPYGLVPISRLGQRLKIATPLIDALINIGSVLCEEDFWSCGRSLNDLGLANLAAQDIIRFVEEGNRDV
ncbi:NAD/NADP octopine/nopaline dehydrogenase family protein [Candidatus Acetothermia bacterium]|nr:NAD/NADP octopine/nopaline dehydrogenase family protein [Candidatus Acetothermia bacterium]MCI2427287.1 NAD/NADP octopine/nopaline dehydrogenase family protein [Candidatus Acetothermia bacterium]MCI2428185.1 NAD/NADP octopine/nopaline dehydrogenase family protein [Candidatus Acetothermia bacterium]